MSVFSSVDDIQTKMQEKIGSYIHQFNATRLDKTTAVPTGMDALLRTAVGLDEKTGASTGIVRLSSLKKMASMSVHLFPCTEIHQSIIWAEKMLGSNFDIHLSLADRLSNPIITGLNQHAPQVVQSVLPLFLSAIKGTQFSFLNIVVKKHLNIAVREEEYELFIKYLFNNWMSIDIHGNVFKNKQEKEKSYIDLAWFIAEKFGNYKILVHTACCYEDGKDIVDHVDTEKSAEIYRGMIQKGYSDSAIHDLALLIEDRKTVYDRYGKYLEPERVKTEAAELYILDYNKSKNLSSLLNYLNFVINGSHPVKIDGTSFETNKDRYDYIAKFLRMIIRESVKTKYTDVLKHALLNYGTLLSNKSVNLDENGDQFKEENRFEKAAICYRKASKFDQVLGENLAFNNIALLIADGKIHSDEKGNTIKAEDRFKVAERLYKMCNHIKSKNNLAYLYIKKPDLLGNISNDSILNVIQNLVSYSASYFMGLAVQKFSNNIELAIRYYMEALKNGDIRALRQLNLINHPEIIINIYGDFVNEDSEEDSEEEQSPTAPVLKPIEKPKGVDYSKLFTELNIEEDEKIKSIFTCEEKAFNLLLRKRDKEYESITFMKKLKMKEESFSAENEEDYNVSFYEFAQEDLSALSPSENERLEFLLEAIHANTMHIARPEILADKLKDGPVIYSRRFTKKDRLIYSIDKAKKIMVWGIRGHYDVLDKMRTKGLLA